MKIKEYKIVAESTNLKMSDDINKLLKDGWELYGFPSIVDGIYFQTLVKPYVEIKEKQNGSKNIKKS